MSLNVGPELLTTCVDALIEISLGKLTEEEIQDIVTEMVRAFEINDIEVQEGENEYIDEALKRLHPEDEEEAEDDDDDYKELDF